MGNDSVTGHLRLSRPIIQVQERTPSRYNLNELERAPAASQAFGAPDSEARRESVESMPVPLQCQWQSESLARYSGKIVQAHWQFFFFFLVAASDVTAGASKL